MTKRQNRTSQLRPLIIFLLIFFLVDSLRIYLDHLKILSIDRLFTWVLPTLLFVRFYLKEDPLDFLKLRGHVLRGIMAGLLIGAVQGIVHVSYYYVSKGHLDTNLDLGANNWWAVILTVGLVEEIVFRGLVLQSLASVYTFRTASLLSSVLFTLAHIPYWIEGGQFARPIGFVVYDFCFVFVVGLLECFFVKKTNSLWTSIIHHSINNFLASVIH